MSTPNPHPGATEQPGHGPSPTARPDVDRSVLPIPPAPFAGTIGLRAGESKASFPHNITAPDGAPNVVLILLDDVGFGAAVHLRWADQHPDHPATGR